MVYATIRQHKDTGTEQTSQTNGQLNGGVNGGVNIRLNDRQKATFEFIRLHEGLNTRQISDELEVPFDTIDKHIRVLLKSGLIEHSAKTGGYYVVNNK